MGASEVGDGHRRRRSWTSWRFVPMGGVANARLSAKMRFLHKNHTNFPLIFFNIVLYTG